MSGELRKRLETHRALKGASPGFHLSDEDIDLLIEALRNMDAKTTHHEGT